MNHCYKHDTSQLVTEYIFIYRVKFPLFFIYQNHKRFNTLNKCTEENQRN